MWQGIFWAFILFNFFVVFALSWFYLHGFQDLKKVLSIRKAKKSSKSKHSSSGEMAEQGRPVSPSSNE